MILSSKKEKKCIPSHTTTHHENFNKMQNVKTSPVQQTTGSQVDLKTQPVQVHNRILYAINNSK